MSKIIMDSNEFENLTAKLSSTPAMVAAILKEIEHIKEDKKEQELRGTARPAHNALNIGYILEEYLQMLSDQFYGLFETAENCKEGGLKHHGQTRRIHVACVFAQS